MKHAALKYVALSSLAAVALTGTAQAQRITAGKVAEFCASRDKAAIAACDAFIDGIEGAVEVYQFLRPRDGSKGPPLPATAYICIPAGTTGVQMREAFVAWAKRHPDDMGRPAAGIVLRSLHETHPCPGAPASDGGASGGGAPKR